MKQVLRILLADDHVMLREGTARLLEREVGIQVVGQADNGEQAVQLTKHLRPDIVVMDIRMPVMNGLEATKRLNKESPGTRVLVLSAYDDAQYIFSLLESGASGYLMKTAPIEELVLAIRKVAAGESPLSPGIAQKVVARMQMSNRARHLETGPSDELTPRELEVLQMLGQGLSNQDLGKKLFISDRTVQAHLTSIFAKMGVTSRLDAVLIGIRRGMLVIEPDQP